MVMGPLHIPCHGFPRAVEALVVQPPAKPVLPNSPFAFAFSLTLPAPFWPLRADILGVPSGFLHAREKNGVMSLLGVLLVYSYWQKKEGRKQAFPLKLAMTKEVIRGKKKQKGLFKPDAVGKNFLRI